MKVFVSSDTHNLADVIAHLPTNWKLEETVDVGNGSQRLFITVPDCGYLHYLKSPVMMNVKLAEQAPLSLNICWLSYPTPDGFDNLRLQLQQINAQAYEIDVDGNVWAEVQIY